MLLFLFGILLLFGGIGLIIAYSTTQDPKKQKAYLGSGIGATVTGLATVGYVLYTSKRAYGISAQPTNWTAPRFNYGGDNYNVEIDYVSSI